MLAHRLRRLVSIAAIAFLPCSALAQTAIPYVVRDLYALPSAVPGNSQPGPLTSFTGHGYFAATSSVNGRELWRTDGTEAGTTLVLDINPGTASSDPQNLVVCNGVLYFTADDGSHGREVWRSDGTASGTRLIGDIRVGNQSSGPEYLAVAGTTLLFYATAGSGNTHLCYTYDGSVLDRLRPVGACCQQNGSCIQTTSGECAGQIWNMWGGVGATCAATPCNQPISAACCMPDKSCVYTSSAACTSSGGTPGAPNAACGSCPDPALFTCCAANGACSVGPLSSCAGTFLFLITSCTPDPCPQPQSACCLPSAQCFMVRFAADCTSRSGTLLAPGQTCISGTYSASCTAPTFACCRTTGACVIVTASNCISSRGYIQPAGVACAAGPCFAPNTTDISPTSGRPVQFGAHAAIFGMTSGGGQLWISDGTVGGTTKLANLPSAVFIPTSDAVAGGRLYFASTNSASPPNALWSTDGSVAGTGPVAATSGMTVYPGTGFANYFFFASPDALGQSQLWRTDGTPGGTSPFTSFSNPSGQPADLSPFPGGLMFTAAGSDSRRRWYISDGTPGGTVLLTTGGSSLYSFLSQPAHITLGNSLLFTASTATNGTDLWITDGSPAGTRLVRAGINAANFSVFNGRAYFKATDSGVNPIEPNTLWTTDGTPAGTYILAHIQGGNDLSLSEMTPGFGNTLFFAAQSPAQGIELYKTDGAPGTTAIVKDIYPGVGSSYPQQLTFNNALLLFTATSSSTLSSNLFRSDGTDSGTYILGSSANYCCSGSRATHPVALGSQVLYFDATPATGMELWRSDGSAAGTSLVTEAISGPADGAGGGQAQPVVFNGSVYYSAQNGFYKSDGSAAGTVRLLDVNVGTVAATTIKSTPIGVFFAGPNGGFWISDGTVAGTRLVWGSNPPAADMTTLTYAGGLLYFAGYTTASAWELWATDGTALGTRMVVELTPGNAGGFNGLRPSGFAAFGSNVYFYIPGPGGVPLAWYVSDGTAAGTRVLFTPAEFPHTITGFYPGHGVLLISASDTSPARQDLWSYSGTVASLTNLTATAPASQLTADYSEITVAGPYTYFIRGSNGTVVGLYRTDGTAAGTTQLLAMPWHFSGTNPGGLVPFGNDVLLRTSSTPGQSSTPGGQLYRTLAPAPGLQTIADFAPTGAPTNLVAFGTSAVFYASTPQLRWQLYSTDGTPGGTQLINPINTALPITSPTAIRKAGPLFYFNSGAADIFRSDGTLAGSFRLDDFSSNGSSSGSIADAADVGGILYFRGYRPSVGAEPWRTDGTYAGTYMLADAYPGVDQSGPANFAAVGTSLYFSGYGYSGTGSLGVEPYISDGTATGTRVVTNLSPSGDSNPTKFTDLNGIAIFLTSNTIVGEELFRSDGTAAGTFLLRDIRPGVTSSLPRDMTRLGNHIYFTADDGVRGRELWRTDGTVAGTVLVRDLCIGPIGSNPTWLITAGDRLYFTAYTPETGIELWSTDGTAADTFLMFEIVSGPSSANIGSLTRAGDRLYFLATVPPLQRSLWSFDWFGGITSGFTCVADYNRIAGITVSDIFDFLSDWFAGASRADVNGDGVVHVADIFDFLSTWFGGC